MVGSKETNGHRLVLIPECPIRQYLWQVDRPLETPTYEELARILSSVVYTRT